jgi:hypothetical protein
MPAKTILIRFAIQIADVTAAQLERNANKLHCSA